MEIVGDVKIYHPGDAEFETLIKEVTPLCYIRKGLSLDGNGIFAEADPSAVKFVQRKENVN